MPQDKSYTQSWQHTLQRRAQLAMNHLTLSRGGHGPETGNGLGTSPSLYLKGRISRCNSSSWVLVWAELLKSTTLFSSQKAGTSKTGCNQGTPWTDSPATNYCKLGMILREMYNLRFAERETIDSGFLGKCFNLNNWVWGVVGITLQGPPQRYHFKTRPCGCAGRIW